MFTLGFIGTWPKKDGVDSVESAKYDLKIFLLVLKVFLVFFHGSGFGFLLLFQMRPQEKQF